MAQLEAEHSLVPIQLEHLAKDCESKLCDQVAALEAGVAQLEACGAALWSKKTAMATVLIACSTFIPGDGEAGPESVRPVWRNDVYSPRDSSLHTGKGLGYRAGSLTKRQSVGPSGRREGEVGYIREQD
ncbi:hypothetical protein EDB86DRAFT_2834611 [Lactarius hatsudake]|nr:hypothetical protein EDB86DRAFT_2834611 [Lactarius hatsudake]